MRTLLDIEPDIDPDALDGYAQIKRAANAGSTHIPSPAEKAQAAYPFTWMLQQFAGDGIRLTDAGYVPPQ